MRKIIHCDCDCFYASVEIRDNKALQFLPVAVGGSSTGRGVITTCNYIARKYGVRSAMPTVTALRLCPKLILLPVNMQKYRIASNQIKAIFLEFTNKVESVSLDEAYLDVSDSEHFSGSASLLAKHIRERIYNEVGVTASAGVAPNKFLAKVASDINKPNGQYVIAPDSIANFISGLPLRRIPGVGKVLEKKLNQLGLTKCVDVQNYCVETLVKKIGSFGYTLYQRSYGKDNREVKERSIRKSVSVERTFPQDLDNIDNCFEKIYLLIESFQERLYKLQDSYFAKAYFVKIKFNDFSQTTLERSNINTLDVDIIKEMYMEAWKRGSKPARLLGLGARLVPKEECQNSMQLDLLRQV